MVDMADISLSWWVAWYLPPFYICSSSTLYFLEFLVGGCSSAGRTGLGSAVLAGFIIGEEIPASPLLGRHLDLASTLPWHSGWHPLLCLGMADIVGISLSWWVAWYLPPFYLGSSSTLSSLGFLVTDISPS